VGGQALLVEQVSPTDAAAAVLAAADGQHLRPAVVRAAADLLRMWHGQAAGYGIHPQHLQQLPHIAVAALAATDIARNGTSHFAATEA
jgi:hypothetical protein